MEYISSKNICLLIRDTLKLIDRRPMDHGSRTGYIMCKMLECKGGYEQYELADFLLLATMHDIGAYKTDNIGDKLNYELRNYMPHSVFGFLFLKYLSPLEDKSRMVLYHQVGYETLQKVNFDYKFETDVLALAEVADIYHYAIGQTFDHHIFRKLENRKYSKEALDLLDEAVKKFSLFEHLRDESYQQELDAILDFMIFPNEEKKKYMEMLMYCIGFRSEISVVDAVITLCVAEELGKLMDLNEDDMELLYYGALLHDLGMLSIPREIIEAPRSLTANEIKLMRTHIEREEKILSNRMDESIVKIAAAHHERCDGTGYPRGLHAAEMNKPQLILQVADIVTGLTAQRAYRKSKTKQEVFDILQEEADYHRLDANVVDAFLGNYDEIMERVEKESADTLLMYERLRSNYSTVYSNLSRG